MMEKSIKCKWLIIWKQPGSLLLDVNDVKLLLNKYFVFFVSKMQLKQLKKYVLCKYAEKIWFQLNHKCPLTEFM